MGVYIGHESSLEKHAHAIYRKKKLVIKMKIFTGKN